MVELKNNIFCLPSGNLLAEVGRPAYADRLLIEFIKCSVEGFVSATELEFATRLLLFMWW